MTSIRHNPALEATRAGSPDDAYLDAAREAILAVGWSRTTLTDIARRAGVSRMTLYRRWPDTQTLLADLMTREWGHVVESAAVESAGVEEAGTHDALERIATGVVATVRALRANAAAAPDRRRRPRGAAALPPRPARPQPGDGGRRRWPP